MNAEQMFEELGYEKKEESEGVLLYISDFENSILFEKKRVTITDLYCYGRITININHLLENAIQKQCKELGWLEEKDEHFEEKAETNAEHYLNDLLKIGRHFCFMHEKVKNCCDVGCAVCTFGKGDCDKERFKWLASQYKKPTYKLSQFEYDLIQTYCYVHEGYTLSKFKRLIKLKDKGYFKCADYDTKIQDILANCEVI